MRSGGAGKRKLSSLGESFPTELFVPTLQRTACKQIFREALPHTPQGGHLLDPICLRHRKIDKPSAKTKVFAIQGRGE